MTLASYVAAGGLAGAVGRRAEATFETFDAADRELTRRIFLRLVNVSEDHAETRRRVEAERACVAAIGGGCLAPVAAHHDGETLTALVAAEDGSRVERRSGSDPVELAQELAALAL